MPPQDGNLLFCLVPKSFEDWGGGGRETTDVDQVLLKTINGVLQDTQGVRLGLSCIPKLCRGQRNRRLPLNLEPYRVMQTARGTGASVSQRFDQKIVVLEDLSPERIRRRLGERRLRVALHPDAG